MKHANRRKNAFADHPLQQKYLRFILTAMGVPAIFVLVCLYYLIWQAVAREVAIPELIAETLFPALERVNLILVIGIPILFAAMTYSAVRLTHRLAGPIYRIEKSLTEIIRTRDFTHQIRIRKDDELHSLVEKINTALREASKR